MSSQNEPTLQKCPHISSRMSILGLMCSKYDAHTHTPTHIHAICCIAEVKGTCHTHVTALWTWKHTCFGFEDEDIWCHVRCKSDLFTTFARSPSPGQVFWMKPSRLPLRLIPSWQADLARLSHTCSNAMLHAAWIYLSVLERWELQQP